MTEWWKHSYPVGKPVPVAGFPRPLHPPDYPLHRDSQPGPDVLAYKRAMSRAGRWPWKPEQWDSVYSEGFALGKVGGKVRDTGISGFQRQMGMNDTGIITNVVFEKMRAVRIPKDLPNAGQPILDATCLNLIGIAWKDFGGHEPEPPKPPPKPTHRELALKKAIGEIGVRESPFASNRQKYGEWYWMNGQPWCAIFSTWCFETSGNSPSFIRGQRYSYVPDIVYDATYHRNGLSLTNSPIPGDLVCFDWHGGGADHVGIFEKGTPAHFTSIEGNTSSTNWSNGGAVMRQDRSSSRVYKLWFVRVS